MILTCWAALLAALPAPAAVILVTGPEQSLQAAIESASDGDTIIVRAGSYIGPFNLGGRRITLRSISGPEQTRLLGGEEQGSVITIGSPDDPPPGPSDPPVVIDGFEIRGGSGSVVDGAGTRGGGILAWAARLHVEDCRIRSNDLTSAPAPGSSGGAIAMMGGSLHVRRSSFTSNFTNASGGAVHLQAASATISESWLHGNRVTAPDGSAFGGAIALHAGDLTVTDSLFRQNHLSAGQGAGGGAIWSAPDASQLTIRATVFWSNSVTSEPLDGAEDIVAGGAVDSGCETLISSSVFVANRVSVVGDGGDGAPRGAGVHASAPLTIVSATFDDHVLEPAPPVPGEAGFAIHADDLLVVRNSIVSEADAGIVSIPELTTLAHLLVGTPIAGEGPIFVADVEFSPTSPLEPWVRRLPQGALGVDMGDNASVIDDRSVEGLRRIDDEASGPSPDAVVDLGAYERNLSLSRVYVAPGGSGSGVSWAEAAGSLSVALETARATEAEVWLAAGTYRPATSADRSAGFHLPPGVRVYGGFAGGESSAADRDPRANPTILSGDQLGNDDGTPASRTDNSRHVVLAGGWPRQYLYYPAILDGVTITGGVADGAGIDGRGGGVLGDDTSIEMTNVELTGNHAELGGGGASIQGGGLLMIRTRVHGNSSGGAGGGLEFDATAASLVVASAITDNLAERGAGIALGGEQGIAYLGLEGSIVAGNLASGSVGAGIDLINGSIMDLVHGSVVDNIAAGGAGAGLRIDDRSTARVTGTILHGNRSGSRQDQDAQVFVATPGTLELDRSLVQGLEGRLGGTGNIDGDPGFADRAAGNLRLTAGSPAIDAGDGPALPRDRWDLDRDGDGFEPLSLDVYAGRRLLDDPVTKDTGLVAVSPEGEQLAVPDIGASEYNPCPADVGGDGAVDFDDVLQVLQTWGPCPGGVDACPGDVDGDQMVGIGDVTAALAAWGGCPSAG